MFDFKISPEEDVKLDFYEFMEENIDSESNNQHPNNQENQLC